MPIDFDALKKIETINLGDYHSYYEGQTLGVWVNPSRRVWVAYGDDEVDIKERVKAYYCTIWDIAGGDFDLLIGNDENDGAELGLWNFLIKETERLTSAYSDKRKKAEKD